MAYSAIDQLYNNLNGSGDFNIRLRKLTPEEIELNKQQQILDEQIVDEVLPAREPASIDPEVEIQRDIESDVYSQPIPMPVLQPRPKIELQSPGAKQYQSVVDEQMKFLNDERMKADAEYDSIMKKREGILKPKSDSFDQILGAMVPLAVAAFGGEAGALSQPAAFKSYQGYLESDAKKKKEDYDRQVKDNELKLKAAERKATSLQNRQNSLVVDSAYKTASMEQAEHKDIQDFDQQIALAKFQASIRPKGAPMGTFEKSALANLGKKVSNMKSSVANFNGLKQIFDRPDLDINVKVQAFNDMLKAYNSPDNPDAVGKEEVNRLSPFLQKLPNPLGVKGMKIGYDVPNFLLQLQNSIDRLNGVIEADTQTAMEIQQGGGASVQKPGNGSQTKPPPKAPGKKRPWSAGNK